MTELIITSTGKPAKIGDIVEIPGGCLTLYSELVPLLLNIGVLSKKEKDSSLGLKNELASIKEDSFKLLAKIQALESKISCIAK